MPSTDLDWQQRRTHYGECIVVHKELAAFDTYVAFATMLARSIVIFQKEFHRHLLLILGRIDS